MGRPFPCFLILAISRLDGFVFFLMAVFFGLSIFFGLCEGGFDGEFDLCLFGLAYAIT